MGIQGIRACQPPKILSVKQRDLGMCVAMSKAMTYTGSIFRGRGLVFPGRQELIIGDVQFHIDTPVRELKAVVVLRGNLQL